MKQALFFLLLLLGMMVSLWADPNLNPLAEFELHHSVNIVSGTWVEEETDLTLPGVEGFALQRLFYHVPRSLGQFAKGWHFNMPDVGKKEFPRRRVFFPPAHTLTYAYDEQHRLKHIEAIHKLSKEKAGFVEISYEDGVCEARSSQGDWVRYTLTPLSSGGSSLTRVEQPLKCCDYVYQPHPKERKLLLVERRELGGAWLKFIYNTAGKVQELFRSYDEGATFNSVCRFEYSENMTAVFDRNGAETRYHYNSQEQITCIETLISGQLYRRQELVWEGAHLVQLATYDAQGKLALGRRWSYDQAGQLIKETLEGILSHEGAAIESYSTYFSYLDGLLIEEKEDNGKKISYTYDQNRCVSGRFVHEGKSIVERSFYTYNAQQSLIEEMQEDELKCTFKKTVAFDAHGFPLEEICGYRDDSQEIILERTLFSYDAHGRLLKKSVYDGGGVEKEWVAHLYDQAGRLKETSTSTGILTQYFKDKKIVFSDNQETHFYFRAGKLVQEETFLEGKLLASDHFIYNEADLLVGKIDIAGHKTSFSYDTLGRKTEEILPPIAGESQAKTHYRYDPLNRTAAVIDSLGYEQTTSFNARGQELVTSYADGTCEEKQYTLAGALAKEIQRDKTYTTYIHDALGRVIKKERYAADHQLLDSTQYSYKGLSLIEEKRSSGIVINYRYDAAGRLLESKISPTERIMCIDYDTQDKLESTNSPKKKMPHQIYRLNEQGENVLETMTTLPDGSQECILHDAWQRPVQISRNLNNLLLDRKIFRYDCVGNKMQETHCIIEKGSIVGEITNRWEYGPHGRLEAQIEALGSAQERRTSYTYTPLGQIETIVQPNGCALMHTYDAAGRLVHFRASDGSFDYTLDYDQNGQLVATHDDLHQLHSIRAYTIEGQLAYEKLGNGLEIQNAYDSLGRRQKMYLPDGSSVGYQFDQNTLRTISRYDSVGVECYSHHYLYYDALGRPLKARLIHDLGDVDYSWSQEGRCISVDCIYFGQQASLDHAGRIVQIKTRDPTGVTEENYSYDALSQLSADRAHTYHFDNVGHLKTKNQHHFLSNHLLQLFDNELLKYDLNGNLIQKKSQEGLLNFSYDALNRLIEVRKNDQPLHRYLYDPFHRRLSDKTPQGMQHFLYDGNHEIGSCNQAGEIQELRLFGLSHPSGYCECISFELAHEVFAPLYNLTGSVVALLSSSSKKIVEWYHYSSFGECTASIEGLHFNPWRYANKRLDPETGLIHFGRRDYDPTLCRWISPDPLGFGDGMHRYAYLHNDPLNQVDLYGLKSISAQWEGIKNFFKNLFKTVSTTVTSNASLGYEQVLTHLVGKSNLLLLGYVNTSSQHGAYGLGEVNDKVRITFINGILADYPDLMAALQGLSKSHGNANIHYVYRPTKGWAWDTLHAFMVKVGLISSEALQLAKDWKTLIAEMGGEGKIFHYAHSIGAVETMRALQFLTAEEQQMIHVYAFGSPSVACGNTTAHIHHFLSVRDGVCLLDFPSLIKHHGSTCPQITFVGSFCGLPLIDHLFFSETYQDLWKSMGRTFTDWYGHVVPAFN